MPSSLGPAEILVILVVALIVLGPKRLPEAARQVGKTLAEVRKWSQGFQDEVRSVIDPDSAPPSYPPTYPPPPAPPPPPMAGVEPPPMPMPASEPPASLPATAGPEPGTVAANGSGPGPTSLDPSDPPPAEASGA